MSFFRHYIYIRTIWFTISIVMLTPTPDPLLYEMTLPVSFFMIIKTLSVVIICLQNFFCDLDWFTKVKNTEYCCLKNLPALC
jgi:hypothetical protein